MKFLEKIQELMKIETLAASGSRISPTELLLEVSSTLAQVHLNFAVAGGFARSVHASPRATGDVDVVVAIRELDMVKAAFDAAGFKYKETLDYQKPRRIILKYNFEGREIDILDYPDHADFVSFLLETATKKSILQASYSFLGLEGLIITKLCSFRFKDKADILDLLKANPYLDIIKHW